LLIFEVEEAGEPADGTAAEIPAPRWSARGFWTVLTVLTGMHVLTADMIDSVDLQGKRIKVLIN
jgi:hypothetical protein